MKGKSHSALILCGFPKKKSGGLAGTRTLDQCLKRALLYQLSYQPTMKRAKSYCCRENQDRESVRKPKRGQRLVQPSLACKDFQGAVAQSNRSKRPISSLERRRVSI